MQKKLTPMKAIRLKCLDCCCGQAAEVKLCPSTDCSLYPYRMGHRPQEIPMYDTGREVTEEQARAIALRLNKRKNFEGDDAVNEAE